jgi:hypothetical protein
MTKLVKRIAPEHLALTQGYYELTEEVENPHPNSRRHGWSHFGKWPKGVRFSVHSKVVRGGEDGRPEVRRNVLHAVGERSYDSDGLYFPHEGAIDGSYDKVLAAILPKLVKIEPTVGEFLHFEGISGYVLPAILAAFIDSGKLTKADVKLAHGYVSALDEVASREFDRKHGFR